MHLAQNLAWRLTLCRCLVRQVPPKSFEHGVHKNQPPAKIFVPKLHHNAPKTRGLRFVSLRVSDGSGSERAKPSTSSGSMLPRIFVRVMTLRMPRMDSGVFAASTKISSTLSLEPRAPRNSSNTRDRGIPAALHKRPARPRRVPVARSVGGLQFGTRIAGRQNQGDGLSHSWLRVES